ncbi:amine oxidase [Zopfochytrium polystomum]|nr:amine oxidase [Zopfochytrium polystomum]
MLSTITPHPLTPLTAAEISRTTATIKAAQSASALPAALASSLADGTAIFNTITLKEPPRVELLSYEAAVSASLSAAPPKRLALATMLASDGTVVEVVVDLVEEKGVQPTLTPDDCFEAERIAISDPSVQRECAAAGFTNLSLVVCDPWSVGYMPEFEGKRLVQLFMYVRAYEDDNHYAHPLDFVPLVDLLSKTVVKANRRPARPHQPFQNTRAPQEIPQLRRPPPSRRHLPCRPPLLKPLDILQPSGPSFASAGPDGHEISWHRFKLRISFNYREGLVLHNVRWVEDGGERSILFRAALNEMVVPYGDPRPPYHRKTAFDVGDYGLGYCANSLELGCDCLGVIKYFDAVLNNNKGEPFTIKNAVCMHEEDAGISWKHTEYRNGKAEVRRNRRLVLSFIATVVNYEYAFYWYFYVDGTISFEIKATGELSTNLVEESELPEFGTLVASSVNAQYHQHMFNMRLDVAVDGPKNSVSELTAVPMADDDPRNVYGNGFLVEETLLKTTTDAQRFADPLRSRVWKIFNPDIINPTTRRPTAFKLVPQATPTLLALPRSSIARRAVFATRHLWVTPHADDEKWAAGCYINQNKGGEGLPEFVKDGRGVCGEALTLWHTFGVTHIPRAEDFPVMPVESAGFTLKPYGFFEANPALDLPVFDKKQDKSVCCA